LILFKSIKKHLQKTIRNVTGTLGTSNTKDFENGLFANLDVPNNLWDFAG
jgi:hypothetical protein